MRDHRPKLRFALKVCTIMALLATGLIFASCARNLTGTYMADDGGVYYMQQSGSTLWWAGLSLDRELPADFVLHRGLYFTNVFRGVINSDNTIVGEWSDVSRGLTLNSGTLTMKIGSSGGVTKLSKLTATGGFGATTWTQTDPLDDTKFNGTTLDIISRFDAVHKNDGSALHENNLKPYRDATVFYGHVVTPHLEYMHDNPYDVEAEVPHVNYGKDFSPPIQNGVPNDCPGTYLDFGHGDRDFTTFACSNRDGKGCQDADLDIRLKIDLAKLEPDFYTTGWGSRTLGPKIFSLKLNALPSRHSVMQAVRLTWGLRQSWWARLEPVIHFRMAAMALPRSCLDGQTCSAPASWLTDDLSTANSPVPNPRIRALLSSPARGLTPWAFRLGICRLSMALMSGSPAFSSWIAATTAASTTRASTTIQMVIPAISAT